MKIWTGKKSGPSHSLAKNTFWPQKKTLVIPQPCGEIRNFLNNADGYFFVFIFHCDFF